jgi:hypothetical protein
MEQTLQQLRELLEKEFHGFELTQRLQFDWLQTIDAQLDQFQRESLGSPKSASPAALIAPKESVAKHTRISSPRTRIVMRPSIPAGTIRFVDDSALLDDSDSDSAEPLPPLPNSAQSMKLPQSPSRFQEDPKGRTVPAMAPIPFRFDDSEPREGAAIGYDISDDSECGDDEDDEIYERNPIEIHGKIIPHWARGEKLLRQLKRQRKTDPDTIFAGFTPECPLALIFNSQKPRWENRADSGWWGPDGIAGDGDS